MRREQSEPRRRRTPVPVTVLGAGHFARAVLPLLEDAGYPVFAVVAPRIAAARRTARLAPGARATTRPAVALRGAAMVLLAVPDREIAPLSARLAAIPGIAWRERLVLHHAGSLGIEALAPLAAVGAGCGVMHPLQCLGEPDLARELLSGSRARVEGDRRGAPAARRFARALGMAPLRFPNPGDDQRAAYHAAAALLSNDLIALLSIGLELFEGAGVPRGQALDGLVSLARGTLLQAGRSGIEGALTGPAPRGDVETLRLHLRQLDRAGCGGEVHRLLSLRLAALARGRGDAAAARRVERALAAPGRVRGGTV